MGFFQKFLSLGSRRKKRNAASSVETRFKSSFSREDARRQQEQEEIANRLLRSSSLRYAVVNEVDYSSLPPIPHPVNSLSHMPSAPPSRSASVQTRRTYTVTIRDRKVEACTEFPNANPHLDSPTHSSTYHWDDRSGQTSTLQPVTPKDQNRLRVLRQDPSVASLLDLYDNKGRLDNDVFSNSPSAAEKEPIKDGRVPLKRGSSTLRQLLGNPESTDCTGSTEGDISWAETFLRERGLGDDQSTASSFHLETPKEMMPVHGAIHEGNPDTTLSDSLHTVDLNTHTAISSMAVEFSLGSDDNPTSAPKRTAESELRPAAEVFGFLLEKRRPRSSMSMNLGSPLPAPRTSLDLKSSRGHVHDAPMTLLYTKQSPSHLQLAEVSASTDTASTPGSILVDPPNTATILNHTRIPIVHGRPRECSHAEQPTTTAITTRTSRIPRGRRSLQLPGDGRTSLSETHLSPISPAEPIRPTQTPTCRIDAVRPTSNAVERQSMDSHLPHKQDAIIGPVPMRSAHRRSVSYGSSRPIPHDWNAGLDAIRAARIKGPKPDDGNKENIIATTENANMYSSRNPKSRLPVTPSRERALLLFAPSPASSADLSPLGQKMMADLRKQRQVRSEHRRNRLAEPAIAHV